MIAGGLVLNAVNQRSNAGLSAPIGHDIVFSLWAAAYAIVGALITIRRPGNAAGWLLLGAGVVFALGSLLYEYANSALGPRPAPGGMIALLLANTLPTAALSLIAMALLLFPNGHLPGPRWRPVAWLSLASIVPILSTWLPAGLIAVAKSVAMEESSGDVHPIRTVAACAVIVVGCLFLAWLRFRNEEL